MFAAVMMQGDNCKQFLEMVLGIEIARIEVSYEKSIIYNLECKGVRLDVYAKDGFDTCYDVEMQVKGKNSEDIPGELVQFLEFVRKDTASNDAESKNTYVKQIQKTIRSIKESREMEHRFQGAWAVSEFRRGKAEGQLEEKRNSVIELLEELGTISPTMHECIISEDRTDVLKAMLKAAAKAESLEQFEEQIANL